MSTEPTASGTSPAVSVTPAAKPLPLVTEATHPQLDQSQITGLQILTDAHTACANGKTLLGHSVAPAPGGGYQFTITGHVPAPGK